MKNSSGRYSQKRKIQETHTENWHLFKFLVVSQNSLVSDFKWLQGDPVLARNLQKLLQLIYSQTFWSLWGVGKGGLIYSWCTEPG